MSKILEEALRPGRGKLADVDISGLESDGDAATFAYTDVLGQAAEGFLMKWKDGWVAYENRCPHWSVPLGDGRGRFLDNTGSVILCPMHGARFEVETGSCFIGPCMDDALEKFEVKIVGDRAEIHRSSSINISL